MISCPHFSKSDVQNFMIRKIPTFSVDSYVKQFVLKKLTYWLLFYKLLLCESSLELS
jgi:hypothetical protein